MKFINKATIERSFWSSVFVTGIALSMCCLGCSSQKRVASANSPPERETVSVEHEATSNETASTDEKRPEEVAAKIVVGKESGIKTPESVLFDADRDIYLVSNVNGGPTDVDNNGFISKLTPAGKVVALKWIEGGKNNVTLNAPKGMAIRDGILFVADITAIRMFDVESGAGKGQIDLDKSTFLNDIALGPDGTLFVSDSGMKPAASGIEDTGSDAIYTIDKENNVKTLISGKTLMHPNGLFADDQGVLVATFGGPELYRVSKDGKKGDSVELPSGSLDGIAMSPDGFLLISSWQASAVYRGKPKGPFVPVVSNVPSPADITYDPKRNRVIIPEFQKDTVRFEPLTAEP